MHISQANGFPCRCAECIRERRLDDGECIGCGGTNGACDCFDDEDDDVLGDYPDCHMHNGSCGKAGSEECDFECPNSRMLRR